MPGPVSLTATSTAVLVRRDVDAYPPAARRVAERVGEQVRERPGELRRIADDRHAGFGDDGSRARRPSRAPGARRCATTRGTTVGQVDAARARARSPWPAMRARSRRRCATSCRRSTSSLRRVQQRTLLGVERRVRCASSSTAMPQRGERASRARATAYRPAPRGAPPDRGNRSRPAARGRARPPSVARSERLGRST